MKDTSQPLMITNHAVIRIGSWNSAFYWEGAVLAVLGVVVSSY